MSEFDTFIEGSINSLDKIGTGNDQSALCDRAPRKLSEHILPVDDMINQILNFDDNQIPPSLDMALNHRKCNLFGRKSDNQTTECLAFCPCCASVKQDQYPLCISTNELDYYGPVIPLFFQLSKFLILMTIFYLCVGIYLQSFIIRTNCSTLQPDGTLKWTGCPFSLNTFIDTAENGPNKVVVEKSNFIIPLVWILSICFFVVYHYFERKLVQQVKHRTLMVSEYTVAVHQLRSDELSSEYIRQLLREQSYIQEGQNIELDIAKICIAQYKGYIIHEQEQLELALDKYLALKKKLESETNKNLIKEFSCRLCKAEKQVKILEKKVDKFKKKIKDNKMNRVDNSIAFVTFATPSEARKIRLMSTLEWLGGTLFPCFFDARQHKITPADEPDDIEWSRVGIDGIHIYIRAILSQAFIGLAIAVFFAIQLAAVTLQAYIGRVVHLRINNSLAVNVLTLPLLPSIVTQVLNFVIIELAIRLTDKERNFSVSGGTLSLTRKLVWIQFVNTAGFPIALHALSTEHGGISNLTSYIFKMLLTNMWLNPLLHTLDPGIFLREFFVKRPIEKKLMLLEPVSITQRELNELFEPADLAMHTRYASVIRTFFVACFFFEMLPSGMLLCLVFMVIQYWVDKYMILRRYKRAKRMSKHLAYGVSWIASSCLFLIVAGHVTLKYVKVENWESLSKTFQPIDLLYLINAYIVSLLNLKYMITIGTTVKSTAKKAFGNFSSHADIHNKPTDTLIDENGEINYRDIWHDLETDYDRLNPMTKNEALERWKDIKIESIHKCCVFKSIVASGLDFSEFEDDSKDTLKSKEHEYGAIETAKLLNLERNLHRDSIYLITN